MLRNTLVLMMVPSMAVAHDGFHVHPHGVEYGWIIALAIGVMAVLAWVRK